MIKLSFTLWDRGLVCIELPGDHNGVDTSKYLPRIIYTYDAENNIFAQSLQRMSSTTPNSEVQMDLRYMLDFINSNRINLKYPYSFAIVVENSVQEHIQKYGRLFFSDLCSYIDLAAYLMSLYGFNDSEIEKTYIYLIHKTVSNNDKFVKDGHPIYGIIPFSSTRLYRNICKIIDAYKE